MQALNSIQSEGVPISCERERSPKSFDEEASRFPELWRRTLRLGGVQIGEFEARRLAWLHRDRNVPTQTHISCGNRLSQRAQPICDGGRLGGGGAAFPIPIAVPPQMSGVRNLGDARPPL